ncbi:MAG: YfhO family protein [Ruminococcus sp.]|nr:YfhO family protein [Ruminococcus sp.]
MKAPHTQRTGEGLLPAFLIGFAAMMITLIPYMLLERGCFIYYGDFNAQQIPFYSLLNDAVRSGQFSWNWFTDLGSDLMTSYSFYLIGSPFFWLTVILPRAAVNFAIPVILAIKHGVASLTAYIYIRRFVRSRHAALTGALLYAFSGFQVFNIFFNHFQDVTALFPLMLIAMEENINNGRRGYFAASVALLAIVNYYFFTGQCVFLVIYYLMRMSSPDFRTSWRKFFLLALEAVLGTMIAAFVLLPTFLLILGNYRINQRLYGLDMVLYSERTIIPRVIQTLFMPVDVPARPNLFQSDTAKWASIGGYFPLFSMVGVLTFMKMRRSNWASRLTGFCGICAAIPILNSAFQALNGYYYARWFYMPLLVMAMMTAQTLDDEEADVRPAVKATAAMLAVFTVIAVLPKQDGEKLVWLKIPRCPWYFFLSLGIAVAGLITAAVLFRRKRLGLSFKRASLWLTALFSVICVLTATLYGAVTPTAANKYIDSAIKGGSGVYEEVSQDNFFRTDISENCDNYPMLWGLPSMRAFQSVVNTSIMDFYAELDIPRNVASRPDVSHYTLRGLFSVKYYYKEIKENADESSAAPVSTSNSEILGSKADIPTELPGFELVGKNDFFEIYKNTLYIPMGFGYDTYVTEKEAAQKSKSNRERLLIKALVLTDEQAEKYSDILTKASTTTQATLTKGSYITYCREKQENASSSFTYDSKGFTSKITLDEPELVFFSVPYSDGWSAQVNGKKVDVEKVSYGFMAVPAQEGENEIVFRYRTPGLAAGRLISAAGLLILIAYLLICRKKKPAGEFPTKHCYGYTSAHKVRGAMIYAESLSRKAKGSKEEDNDAS